MGILDDAIREHLDLKRKHGVSEEEVQRQQDEALGPARREVAQQSEDAEIGADGTVSADAAASAAPTAAPSAAPIEDGEALPFGGEPPGTPSAEAPASPRGETLATDPPVPDAPPATEALPVEPVPDEPPAAMSPEREPAPEPEPPSSELPSADEPEEVPQSAESFAAPEPTAAPLDEPGPTRDPLGDTEPHGFPALDDEDAEHLEDGELAASDPDHEDVLEDTPDFLQETPEHDRLWFEQKPPRDFDFD